MDGLRAAAGAYSGDYTPPAPGGQFRIGFAGYGWGSTRLDVDEVAIYNRALSASEILRSAYFYAAMTEAVAGRFEAAERALERKDYAAAEAECAAIMKLGDVHPSCAALARLPRGQALREQRKHPAAVAEFARLLETPTAPEALKRAALSPLVQLARQARAPRSVCEAILAMDGVSVRDKLDLRLALAGHHRQERNYDAARREYGRVLDMSEASSEQKLNVRLQLGHTTLEVGDGAAARAEYAKIAATPDTPAHFRSYAQLLIVQSHAREKSYAAAKAEYEKLVTTPDAPEHHRWEAHERMRELERIQAGLPARDPSWSRMQLPKRPAPAVEMYVAADGADANPGTRKKPLATLARARDAIRALRKDGELPKGGVTVRIKPGEYRLAETCKLTAEDTGTEASPIVYRAEMKGAAVFTGGVRPRGFQPVQDAAILARLPESARGKVVQLDLKAQGITDLGEMKPRGYGRQPYPALELFFNGKAMPLARWPNEGFVKTGKVHDEGAANPPRGAVFAYDGDRPARWQQARDAMLFGYWHWLWGDGTLAVAAIDPQARQIRTVQTYGKGVKPNMPYWAFNLIEELDAPGEWYLDRATGILYFYPPSDPAKATVQLSMLAAPMAQLDEVSHVTFEGLVFELGRATGLIINGGERCLLAACVGRQLGGDGVVVNGGKSHGVLSCDLHTLGRGGTRVKGGDRKTLAPGGHFVENCHIHDFSRLDRTYTPAVWMDGVGNRIAHNLFHDSPGHAIRLEGNDHVIEFNEIHHVVTETDDQGGLDIWFNPTYRGNVMRFNFWHDIGSGGEFSQAGIRLDDAISGVHIYGNVFWRCSNGRFGGLQIHGGKENVVENNLFADCKYGISFSGWGEKK